MPPTPDLPLIELDTPGAWEQWLIEHPDSTGVWLKIAKPTAPTSTPSYKEALDVALCFGWIDGQKGAIDEHYWRQRFTPRGRRSKWSKINREHAERLIAAGRMRDTGQAEVDRAKEDGRWEAAYDSQANAQVPDDFALALSAHPEAKAFFETLTGANRYAFLYRIQDAKKPETRANRIATFVEMLAERRTFH